LFSYKHNTDHFYLHRFCATFAARALWNGVDLRPVQQWMGHIDLESTLQATLIQADPSYRMEVEQLPLGRRNADPRTRGSTSRSITQLLQDIMGKKLLDLAVTRYGLPHSGPGILMPVMASAAVLSMDSAIKPSARQP